MDHRQIYIPEPMKETTIIYITLDEEISSFTSMYKTGKTTHIISENNVK
jgi:hypothetical protein